MGAAFDLMKAGYPQPHRFLSFGEGCNNRFDTPGPNPGVKSACAKPDPI
jgi:hypothetical protein